MEKAEKRSGSRKGGSIRAAKGKRDLKTRGAAAGKWGKKLLRRNVGHFGCDEAEAEAEENGGRSGRGHRD